jgi:hypothetical protein
MSSKVVQVFVRSLVLVAGVVGAVVLFAQTQPASNVPAVTETTMMPAPVDAKGNIDGGEPKYIKPETAEQRKARLGTDQDPGPNPDPQKHFWRYGKSVHIERYLRKFANDAGGEPGTIRPFGYVNFWAEIYQQNDKYVWVWLNDPVVNAEESTAEVAPVVPSGGHQYTVAEVDYLKKMKSEFVPVEPPVSTTTIRFENSSSGLPTTGSWRNSLAVADMNGDGFPDLIAPPERKGNNIPAIFLGDGKGNWKHWPVKFPRGVDYGSVVAADFNRDGKMDLAFGIHLQGVAVFLGDGKGQFTDASDGLPTREFPTRRIAVADVNDDGYPDLLAISEGPSAMAENDLNKPAQRGIVSWINRNKGRKWELAVVADNQNRVGGDWLTVAHLNSDRNVDIIGSSIFFNSNSIVYLSDGKAKWKPLGADGYLLPSMSYYIASTAGRFASKKLDDVLVSYVRFWPGDTPASGVPVPAVQNLTGIDMLSFSGKTAKRTPVVRWSSGRWVTGLASGDFNGDGNLDVLYTRFDPREAVILLGDGKGGFTRATVDGLKLDPNSNYDVKVADVNGDGKPDVIVMYESSGSTAFASRDGSIQVFLNRGAQSGLTASASSK